MKERTLFEGRGRTYELPGRKKMMKTEELLQRTEEEGRRKAL